MKKTLFIYGVLLFFVELRAAIPGPKIYAYSVGLTEAGLGPELGLTTVKGLSRAARARAVPHECLGQGSSSLTKARARPFHKTNRLMECGKNSSKPNDDSELDKVVSAVSKYLFILYGGKYFVKLIVDFL